MCYKSFRFNIIIQYYIVYIYLYIPYCYLTLMLNALLC